MDGYMDYKDICLTLGVGKNKAYQILKKIRKESGFDKTYESEVMPTLLIPTEYFKKVFPFAKIKYSKN